MFVMSPGNSNEMERDTTLRAEEGRGTNPTKTLGITGGARLTAIGLISLGPP